MSLRADAVIALADTACGYGTIAHLPDGAKSFTTIELKSNFLGTATEGALFRCTQIILWPRGVGIGSAKKCCPT